MRKAVKIALNAMLNASETMQRPPRGFRRKDCNCSWKELSEAIMHTHKPIANKFYTGQGLRLQKIDSDIAEYVMLHFKNQRMPVLPLHDSFIIRLGYEETIETAMQRAFKKFVGAEIKIKEKVMSNVDSLEEDERVVWEKKQLKTLLMILSPMIFTNCWQQWKLGMKSVLMLFLTNAKLLIQS